MKIRLGILDGDELYKSRFINFFNIHYAEKVEIHSFTNEEYLQEYLAANRLDVILAQDTLLPNPQTLADRVAIAYWSDELAVESIRSVRAICRYQKAEMIFKEIISLYADVASSDIVYKHGSGKNCFVFCFLGVAGGVGTSTMAAACALNLTNRGKKVLFLDLTEMGQTSTFFHGEGSHTLSDVFYAIKSANTNLGLKLSSMAKKDASGVSFFESAKVALDVRDATVENIQELLRSLVNSQNYEAIVIDTDSQMTEKLNAVLAASELVVFVNNGSAVANEKLKRMLSAYQLENNPKTNICRKMAIVYNAFRTENRRVENLDDLLEIGGAQYYRDGNPLQIANEIAKKDMFYRFIAPAEV